MKTSSLLLALLVLPQLALASALPVVRVSWNDCTPLVINQDSNGQASYAWNMSAIGMTGKYAFFHCFFQFWPDKVAPAWQFFDFDNFDRQPGCQGPARMTTPASGGSCAFYPTQFRMASMTQSSITGGGGTFMQGLVSLDSTFVADPAQRYTLLHIVFDQSHGVEGSESGSACGGLQVPMCVAGQFGLDVRTTGNNTGPTPIAVEQSFLSWQDATNALRCPGAAPAHATSWGAVKAQYR